MTMNDTDATHFTCQRRCRLMVVAVAIALMLAGCSAQTPTADLESADSALEVSAEGTTTSEELAGLTPQALEPQPAGDGLESATEAPTATPTPTPHPIAVADTELPPAPIGFDSLPESVSGPQPISIEIEDIGVQSADVIPVGVNEEDLSFEVPPADQVGWYEFGPAPGEGGSSVLAAHIAYNGVDGVFRYLEDVEVGAIVVVGFDDGSSQRFRIEEVTEYVKEVLPDSLFARDGKEQLALITCGGAFNEQLDSYESNTVAIAVPLDI